MSPCESEMTDTTMLQCILNRAFSSTIVGYSPLANHATHENQVQRIVLTDYGMNVTFNPVLLD
jgi:hypothetical protein